MAEVLVIGGIYRESLPPSHDPVHRIGGSGFVAALTAARLGAEVALASFVGERDARAALGPLRRAGVDTRAVVVCPGVSGIFEFSDPTDRSRPKPMYRPAESTPPVKPPADLPVASVVLAFGFPDFDPWEWIEAGLDSAGTFLWDRQGWLSRRSDPLFIESLEASRKIYVANLQEAQVDANRTTVREALLEQPAAGFDASLVKCGRWGTIAIERDAAHVVGAFPAEISSAIGSGDCFAGAVACRLAQRASLVESTAAGAAAASLFVARESNIPPIGLAKALENAVAGREQVFVSPGALERLFVYLAGPFFTEAEARLVGDLEAALGHMGVSVVSPRRDVGALPHDAQPELVRSVGDEDLNYLAAAHLVCAILDGDDSGTLMEVGAAAQQGKAVVGLLSSPAPVPQPIREALGVRVAMDVDGLLWEITRWIRERFGI